MKLEELLKVANANTLVTITTCGKHGGCMLMETPLALAKKDLSEHKDGILLACEVTGVRVYRNTLEIVIDKEARMGAEKTGYCPACGCEVPYYTEETEWEGNYRGVHRKARLLTTHCAKCGTHILVKEVEYENQRRLADELL